MTSSNVSTQISDNSQGGTGRILRWTGLAVLFVVLGAGIGVLSFGPSMLGASLAKARFDNLNTRIRGMLQHDSCELSWRSEGKVRGLRMVDQAGTELFRGEANIPPLSSREWTQGLLPRNARVELEQLVLSIDEAGVCSLLERLMGRSENGAESPFFDAGHLEEAASYEGSIETLTVRDERSPDGEVVLPKVNFSLEWGPNMPGSLTLSTNLQGGDGEHRVEINLKWLGMGSTFQWQSLSGDVQVRAASAFLGKLLGVPSGLVEVFGPELRLAMRLGASQTNSGQVSPLGIPFELDFEGGLDYVGEFRGHFDGKSWRMGQAPERALVESILDNPHQAELGLHSFMQASKANTDGESQSKDVLQVSHSHAGVLALFSQVSGLFPQPENGVALHCEEREGQVWTLRMNHFESGVAAMRSDLPLLESWLSACRYEVQVETPALISLGAKEVKQSFDSVNLESGEITWSFDGAKGTSGAAVEGDLQPARGQGVLKTAYSEQAVARLQAVAASLAGAQVQVPGADMRWSVKGPLPGGDCKVEGLLTRSVPTQFFSKRLGGWAQSLEQIFGRTSVLRLSHGVYPDPDGGEQLCWQVEIQGSGMDLELIPIYFDLESKRVWTAPGKKHQALLETGLAGGIFERFLSPFLPWFDSLSLPGDRSEQGGLYLTFSDLLVEVQEGDWRITRGWFEFVELAEAEYSIAPGWKDGWGPTDQAAPDELAFEVDGPRVSFEELDFPMASFSGMLDLELGTVRLKVESTSLLVDIVAGDLVSGSFLQGDLEKPVWLNPRNTKESGSGTD